MSGRLVGKVLESNLKGPLKFVAVVMANFASDDGRSIFPSVATVAGMVDLCERQVQRYLAELRAIGVLVVTKSATPRAATEYRLIESRLPVRGDIRGDVHVTPGVTLGVTSDVTRSVIDPEDPSLDPNTGALEEIVAAIMKQGLPFGSLMHLIKRQLAERSLPFDEAAVMAACRRSLRPKPAVAQLRSTRRREVG